MLNMLSEAEICGVEQINGVAELSTSDCVVRLTDGKANNRLIGATVIAYEIGCDEETSKFYLGLLCESSDGTLFDETITFSAIEVAELD